MSADSDNSDDNAAGSIAAAVTRWPEAGAAHDEVAEETAVALAYNGIAHAVMMATPCDLEDFALGFSLSEGILQHPNELYALECERRSFAAGQGEGIEIEMTISAERFTLLKERRRNLVGRTGCGLCGAESLEQAIRPPQRVGDGAVFSAVAIQRALAQLPQFQPLQQRTGAVHAAAWCNAAGEIVMAREDVGRHNALDKLIGAMARQGGDHREDFLLLSSRASYEMVAKAAAAGFQLVAAVSAPTALAIKWAELAGITLVGFTRPGRHSIYTNPQRMRTES